MAATRSPWCKQESVLFLSNGHEDRAGEDAPRCPRDLPPSALPTRVCGSVTEVNASPSSRTEGGKRSRQGGRTPLLLRELPLSGSQNQTPRNHTRPSNERRQRPGRRKDCDPPGDQAARAGDGRRGGRPPPGSEDGYVGRHGRPRNSGDDAARGCPAEQWGPRHPSAARTARARSGSTRVGCPLLQPRGTLTSRVPSMARGPQKWRVSQESAAALSPAGRLLPWWWHMRPLESPSVVCGHLPAMKTVSLSAQHFTQPSVS